MKKIFLLSLSASMLLAVSLVLPADARAESSSWKDQLASFGGSSDFDGGLSRDPAPPSFDRRLERELLRDETELTQDTDLETLLLKGHSRFDRILERLIDQQIAQLDAQIAEIETILSETL